MKNLFVFFLFIFVTTICSAQAKLQVNKEGVYRVQADSIEWVNAEITAHPEALRYDLKFSEAIANPGKEILGERSEKILRLKLPFKKQVEVKKYFIIYDSQTKNIGYLEATPVRKEEPSYLILFSIISILLMIISNILYKKGLDGFAAFAAAAVVVAFAAAAAVAAFAVAVAATFAFAFAAFATFAFAFAAVAEKDYKVFSVIFYILMAVHIALLFV
ncbi:MAG: hypothetical protein PHP37_01855 [Patescibacteria group bacterium]|nr:hypothetical protein [Patescibacteria group bacterium]